jgi:hypothetical protein
MLNTLPSSVAHFHPGMTIPHRRRGGQPSNRNALRHGLYAAKNRTPLTEISSSLSTFRQIPDSGSASGFQQMILDLQEDICQVYQFLEKAENNRSKIAYFNTLVKMVNTVGRLKTGWALRFLTVSELQFVSQNAHALIRRAFWENGITGDADSFRDNCYKSDFNSLALNESLCASRLDSPYPFLTPRQ